MPALEAIASMYLEAHETSVTFTSIPSTYDALQVRFSGRAQNLSTGYGFVLARLGTGGSVDSGSNYSRSYYRGTGTTKTITLLASQTSFQCMMATSAYENAILYGMSVLNIEGYAHANKNTSISYEQFTPITPDDDSEVGFGGGVWDNDAVVDTLFLKPNTGAWTRGSTFHLYGWNYS